MPRFVKLDTRKLEKWMLEIGWSRQKLAKKASVSRKTVERCFSKRQTSSNTHFLVMKAIRKGFIDYRKELGLPVDYKELPSSFIDSSIPPIADGLPPDHLNASGCPTECHLAK